MYKSPYSPVEAEADLPAHCAVCGRALVRDDHRIGYDRTTGREITSRAVRCPKGRLDSGHEAFVVTRRPDATTPPPF